MAQEDEPGHERPDPLELRPERGLDRIEVLVDARRLIAHLPRVASIRFDPLRSALERVVRGGGPVYAEHIQ